MRSEDRSPSPLIQPVAADVRGNHSAKALCQKAITKETLFKSTEEPGALGVVPEAGVPFRLQDVESFDLRSLDF
jgi:hypothetical protein